MNMILTPVLTPPLDTEVGGERTTVQLADIEKTDGGYVIDLSRLERFIDICLANGIKYFEINHFFTQWGAEHAPKIVATVDGEGNVTAVGAGTAVITAISGAQSAACTVTVTAS